MYLGALTPPAAIDRRPDRAKHGPGMPGPGAFLPAMHLYRPGHSHAAGRVSFAQQGVARPPSARRKLVGNT